MTDDYSSHGAEFGFTTCRGDPLRHLEPPARPLVVALCSRAMGSGKTAVADHLVAAHGFVRLKFAGQLKAMTRTLLAELGMPPAEIEQRVEGDLKESEIPALGRSCRYVMQRLGTEWGRDCLHPNVWADITVGRALDFVAAGKSVVLDDMRYRNELDAVLAAGGTGVRVLRAQATITEAHSSEGELDAVDMPALDNNWLSLDRLHDHIDTVWLPRLADSLNS